MFSTGFELAGFAAFAVAAFLAGGVIALLLVLGVELLLVGFALDGTQLVLRRPERPGRRGR